MKMTLQEIVTKLANNGYQAKMSRDGTNVVVSCGDKGFLRVHVGSAHPHAVDGVHIANYMTCGRATAINVITEIHQTLAK